MANPINLNNIMLKYTDLSDAGSALYNIIQPQVEASEHVTIDMENVTSLPSIFLNVSIGKIIDEFGMEAIKKLSFIKITKAQADRLQKYLANYNA